MKGIKRFFALFAVIAAVFAMTAPVPAESAELKSIVTYFSVSGHTEQVADWIADLIGADKFRITPKTPYDPATDLSQTARRDPNSRVNTENKDDAARPEIAGTVDDIAKYDVIFVGHPIWFGKAPKVVRTFLESLDLSGKTIVTFCTSGSSEIGDTSEQLRSSFADSAKLVVGKSFRSPARGDVSSWLKTLGLGFNPKD